MCKLNGLKQKKKTLAMARYRRYTISGQYYVFCPYDELCQWNANTDRQTDRQTDRGLVSNMQHQVSQRQLTGTVYWSHMSL